MAFFGTLASGQAAVAVTWSGGNGAPLTLTFSQPIVFNVDVAPGLTAQSPLFVVAGAGDLFGGTFPDASGLTYSINGGSDQPISKWNSGLSGGAVVATDTYFFGVLPGVSIGDVVTLNAGTLTGLLTFAAAPPSQTSADMFLVDSEGTNLSTAGGTVVPESSAAVLGSLSLLGLLRRRR